MLWQQRPEILQLSDTCGDSEKVTTQHLDVRIWQQIWKDIPWYYLPKALNRETISWRLSWKDGLLFLALGIVSICLSENRILRAVPRPCVYKRHSFGHSQINVFIKSLFLSSKSLLSYLQFAPKSAFKTFDTVHDAWNVLKGTLEVLLIPE